jgi:hypothetical protein
MNKLKKPLLVLAVVLALAAVVAVVKRDLIADLILKGGDTSLAGEEARSSPLAALATDFLVALRASDMNAIARLATADQLARIQQEAKQPTPDFQDMKKMMLGDLPANPSDLRAAIKSVQIHKHRGVVLFDTKANSWFVTLDHVNGQWKIAGI